MLRCPEIKIGAVKRRDGSILPPFCQGCCLGWGGCTRVPREGGREGRREGGREGGMSNEEKKQNGSVSILLTLLPEQE